MSIIKKYQPAKGTCKVTFTHPIASVNEAKIVQVLGDFNGWDSTKAPKMKAGKADFTTEIELTAGQIYEFRYLLDGLTWDNDHSADSYVPSPFDGINNGVIVLDAVVGAKSATTKSAATKPAKETSPKAKATTVKPAKVAAAPKVAKVATPKATAPKVAKVATPKAAKEVTAKVAKTAATPKVAKAATPKAAKVETPKVAAPKVAKVVAPKVAKVAAPKVVKAAAPKVAKTVAPKTAKDDLKKIEGIGPKIAELLIAKGIVTFKDLAKAKVDTLKTILNDAGSKFTMHDPTTWAKQSDLAAKGNWAELKKLQDELNGGKTTK